jgi:hypothetical protein
MIFKLSLPSVEKTLGKERLLSKKTFGKKSSLSSVKKTFGKETVCQVSKIKHFAECFLPMVFCLALDKELICRVPERNHSVNYLALGKEPNSGSDCHTRI